jgi:hypothetical protein
MASERTLELRKLASQAKLVVDNGPGLNRKGRRRYRKMMRGKFSSLLPPKEMMDPDKKMYKVDSDGKLTEI